jgi:hypothetical protein
MFGPIKAFKSPVVLDEELHKELRIKKPENYSAMENLEVVPLGFSELIPATMYYPVMIARQEDKFFPFAVLGVNKKNIYLNEEGFFKVDVVPKVCELYPFSVKEEILEDGTQEWAVVVDLECAHPEGERLFTDDGENTPYFAEIKQKLTQFIVDCQKAMEFCNELATLGCIRPIDIEVNCKYGKGKFKNVYIGDIENLRKIQPEKLYYLNTTGYLPMIYALYFSARNFKLFELI